MVDYIKLQAISLYQTSFSIEESQSINIQVNYTPYNASMKTIQWKSSDPTIASIDSYGLISGLNEGKVQITGISDENPDLVVSSIITVTPYQIQYQDKYIVKCIGQGYNGHFEDATFIDTLKGTSGIDSLIVLTHLSIQTQLNSYRSLYLYEGDSILIGSNYYKVNDSVSVNSKTIFGCDSISHYLIKPRDKDSLFTQVYINKCFGEIYKDYTVSGDYTEKYTSSTGTDSMVVIHLYIMPNYISDQTVLIAKGDSILINSVYYKSPTMVDYKTTNKLGCDSVIHYIIKYESDTLTQYLNVVLCSGESYNGHSVQGTFIDWFKTNKGRDSVVTSSIYIIEPQYTDVSLSLIKGDSLYLGTSYYSNDGDYDLKLKTNIGCDSTIHYHITFKVVGDINNNGIIDDNEVAGDVNGDGIIDNGEIAGDVNGDKKIDGNEIAGDINGNEVIDNSTEISLKSSIRNEICGDVSGDGTISGTEICGDKNGDGVIQSKSEVIGDINGDAQISNREVLGDTNGNKTIDLGETSTTETSIITKADISIYPNPVNNILNIEFGLKSASGTITIWNILGTVIREIKYESQNIITINTQSLSAGMYIIKVKAGEKVYSQKIIKE
jgi:hypothetical protein